MAALTSQSFASASLANPTTFVPTASDTIAANQFGPNGCLLRAITAGTPSNVTVADPGVTPSNNPGTPTAVACPATGARMIPVPLSAVNASGVATITSSSQAAMTYELYRY